MLACVWHIHIYIYTYIYIHIYIYIYLHIHSHEQAHIVLGADLVRFICCGGILRKFSGYGLKTWTGNFFMWPRIFLFSCNRTACHCVPKNLAVMLCPKGCLFTSSFTNCHFSWGFPIKTLYVIFIVLFLFDLFTPKNSGKNTSFAGPIRNFFSSFSYFASYQSFTYSEGPGFKLTQIMG